MTKIPVGSNTLESFSPLATSAMAKALASGLAENNCQEK
jgi:hypothetical protein